MLTNSLTKQSFILMEIKRGNSHGIAATHILPVTF